MRDSLRHAVAEFIGTFALVFVGSGVLLLARVTGQPISLLEIALAHGLILAVMVTATMRISGHLNPAVTIGFLATRRIAPLMGLVYIAARGKFWVLFSLLCTNESAGCFPGGGFFLSFSAHFSIFLFPLN